MITSNKSRFAFLLCSFFVTAAPVVAKEASAPNQQEFKYKTAYGDLERKFVKNFFGNVKTYTYDALKNFQKHPELFVLAVGGLTTGTLYKKEIKSYVEEFLYGTDKQKGHKDKVVVTVWALLLGAYLAKDNINKRCFVDEEDATLVN